jgi:hypothetical protein
LPERGTLTHALLIIDGDDLLPVDIPLQTLQVCRYLVQPYAPHCRE